VLAPGQAHRGAIDGQIDISHHRALFDLGPHAAARTSRLLDDLLDHELDVAASARVVQDPDVFEAHQGLDDLARVREDEGAS